MENNLFIQTFQFSDIITSRNDFLDFVDNYTTIDRENEGTTILDYIYFILNQNYLTSNVAYPTPNSFLRHFGLTLNDYYYQIKTKLRFIDSINNISEEDARIVSEAFSTTANNDNTSVVNPLSSALNYVTQQLANREYSNKITAYLEVINNAYTNLIGETIGIFRNHFYNIFTEEVYLYE